MAHQITSLAVEHEQDVVAARQRARQIALLLGFEAQDQTRIATAVSEIARNAFVYGRGGKVEFTVDTAREQTALVVEVRDRGPGIAALQSVLDGEYRSQTGLGMGITGARRLMDRFEIESEPGRGTTVVMAKILPGRARPIAPLDLVRIADELAKHKPEGAFAELQRQNKELLGTLEELRLRQEQLARLNSELEDTNRGVVALYAELDEKAESLRRADALKGRFLSYVSHEFRTPLNSIIALARILLERSDGDLSVEQERQAQFIERAALDLTGLVNDLLDLARVEAGKIEIRPGPFAVSTLFSGLRGMMRPLGGNPAVILIFDEEENLPVMQTDEGKVAQILRNLLSNALKFTERGEIRVSARLAADGEAVVFAVADTGIGIAPEHQDKIFLEFGQVESPIQRLVKGVGLGLPLSKKLAELLGGTICLESKPGVGSTFYASIPVVYGGLSDLAERSAANPATATAGQPETKVLIVDDDRVSRYLLKGLLQGSPLTIVEAENGPEALRLAREVQPRAIFLDLMMPEMDGAEVLRQLKADEETREIPVIIATGKVMDEEEQRRLAAMNVVGVISKATQSRVEAIAAARTALEQAIAKGKPRKDRTK